MVHNHAQPHRWFSLHTVSFVTGTHGVYCEMCCGVVLPRGSDNFPSYIAIQGINILTKCSHLSSSISYTYSFIYSFANLPTPMTLSFHTALLKSFIKDSAYHWGTSFYPKKHFFFSCTHHIYLYLSNTASCFLIYIALIYIVSPSSHFFRL